MATNRTSRGRVPRTKRAGSRPRRATAAPPMRKRVKRIAAMLGRIPDRWLKYIEWRWGQVLSLAARGDLYAGQEPGVFRGVERLATMLAVLPEGHVCEIESAIVTAVIDGTVGHVDRAGFKGLPGRLRIVCELPRERESDGREPDGRADHGAGSGNLLDDDDDDDGFDGWLENPLKKLRDEADENEKGV